MSDTATIYALRDPRTNELRYIGKTTTLLSVRLDSHVSQRDESYRSRWVRSLAARPLIEPLMIVPKELASAAEKYAIAIHRSLGFRLTNLSNGGEGCEGYRHSPETLVRLSAINKGKIIPPETRAKIAAAHRGKTISAEHRAKVAAAGRGRIKSPETIEKLRRASTGRKHTEEVKARLSAAKKGKPAHPAAQAALAKASKSERDKTHCKRGHEYTTDNTTVGKHGWRNCKRCNTERARQRRRRLGTPLRTGYAKSHCANGHLYTPESASIDKHGVRRCKTCRNEQAREIYKERSTH